MSLHDSLAARLPTLEFHAAGDCSGLGLIRNATEEGARLACAI
jgi:2,4-dienoyl-CoA reductase (NADPH2)